MSNTTICAAAGAVPVSVAAIALTAGPVAAAFVVLAALAAFLLAFLS